MKNCRVHPTHWLISTQVARDNLDLVAYWAPTDKSCRPKCRRFQNDRDLGKNGEDTRACLLADLAQAALGPENPAYRRGIDGQIDKKIRETALQRRWQPVRKSKLYGAFVLNRRVVLHAIDATPARWRGGAGSSPLGAITAASCTN